MKKQQKVAMGWSLTSLFACVSITYLLWVFLPQVPGPVWFLVGFTPYFSLAAILKMSKRNIDENYVRKPEVQNE